MKKIIALILLCACVLGADVPSSPWDHPRLFLDDDMIDTLQARYARGHYYASACVSWAANTGLSWTNAQYNVGGEHNMEMLALVNLAYAWKITGNSTYLDKAKAVLLYTVQNPPHSSHTEETYLCSERWHPVRYRTFGMALTLDIIWNELTEAERSIVVGELTDVLEHWYGWANHGLRGVDSCWACNNPGNNYGLGDYRGLLTLTYILYHHNDDIPTYHAYLRDTCFVNTVRYYKDEEMFAGFRSSGSMNTSGHAKGGLVAEGTGYGGNDIEMAAYLCYLVADVEDSVPSDWNLEYPTEYFYGSVYNQLPNQNPINQWQVRPEGDNAGTAYIGIAEYTSMATWLSFLTDSDSEYNWGYYWMNNYVDRTNGSSSAKMIRYWKLALLLEDWVSGTNFLDSLDTEYYASGVKQFLYKSNSFDDSNHEIWACLYGGVGTESHMHNACGDFQVFRGDYLTGDVNKFLGTSEAYYYERYHNLLWVEPGCNSGCDSRFYYSENIDRERYSTTDDYWHICFDLTDAYTAIPATWRYTAVKHKEREALYIRAETTFVLCDRVQFEWDSPLYGASDPTDTRWQMWFQDGQISKIGTQYLVDNTIHKMYLHMADLPDNADDSICVNCEGLNLERVDIYPPQPTGTDDISHSYLNIMKVTVGDSILTLAAPSVSNGNAVMGGWHSAVSAARDYVVLFADGETDGAEGGVNQAFDNGLVEFTYNSSRDTTLWHLMGCATDASFWVDTTRAGTTYTAKIWDSYVKAEGDKACVASTPGGVLRFGLGSGINVAVCSLSVASLDFDTVTVGTGASMTFKIYNVGADPCPDLIIDVQEYDPNYAVRDENGVTGRIQTLIERNDSLMIRLSFSPFYTGSGIRRYPLALWICLSHAPLIVDAHGDDGGESAPDPPFWGVRKRSPKYE